MDAAGSMGLTCGLRFEGFGEYIFKSHYKLGYTHALLSRKCKHDFCLAGALGTL